MLKKIVVDKANRLYQLPPDLFSFTHDTPKKKLIKNIDTLDIGSFSWPVSPSKDLTFGPTDLVKASEESLLSLKELLADWFYKQYRVKLNGAKEIFVGSGITSMFNQLCAAFIDAGDVVFIPDLALPLYKKAITAASGETLHYEINHKNNWQPNFERVTAKLGRVSRMLVINSPHNPTGAVLAEAELEQLLWTAAKDNIILVNDAAYQSLGDTKIPSLMQVAQAKKVAVEMYSFAYNFGLPALPFGFTVGNRDLIHGLKQSERLQRGFIPEYFVAMAKEAINRHPNSSLTAAKKQFKQNAALLGPVLELLQLENCGIGTLPFVWSKIERRKSSMNLSTQLYRRSRILTAPGIAFGDCGEGYIRFSLTAKEDTYREAASRIRKKLRFIRAGGDES